MRNSYFTTLAKIFVPAAALALLTGCGLGNAGSTAHTPTTGVGALSVNGNVHGGQQPVGGSTINIYAVGDTGYGSAAVSLLKNGVTVKTSTDGGGSFTLTGTYVCGSPDQRVYVTATGGDAGSGPNNALAMMAALGRCGDLTASKFISLNEVTTVASVWALAPFMTGITNIGAPASNVVGINNAFDDVNELTTISQGSAGGASLPAGTAIPVAAINTLADILASCINSNGATSACTTLFAGTTVGGNVPTDTLTAALNMAQHPAVSVASLFPLATPQSPFQPKLVDQPSDFTLAATFSGFTAPSSVAADAGGNVWVTDSSANTLTQLAHSGASTQTVSGLSIPSGIAIDQSGNAWLANAGSNSLAKVTPGGAVSTFTGGGMVSPRSTAVDGMGNVWVANGGANIVSAFSSAGSGSGFVSAGGTPLAIAFNPQ